MKCINCLLLIILFFAGCRSNLIKNAGAELKPVTNEWTTVEGKWTQRLRAPLPQEGKAYFFPGVAQHAELYQDADVSNYAFLIDYGLVSADYTGYVRAFPQNPADEACEIIEFRDVRQIVLDSFKSAGYDSTNAWVHIADNHSLPAGTRTIRVRLISDRHNGSNNDGYHDNISLTLSFSLLFYIILIALICGILLTIILLKRKRKAPAIAT